MDLLVEGGEERSIVGAVESGALGVAGGLTPFSPSN